MPCMLSIAWELRLTKRVILLVRNGRLLSCKATADILSRICGGRFKFTLADNQLKVKNTKLPMGGISKIIPIQTWGCPCLELEKKKPKKKAKKSTKTVPRRHCLLWFYYFSILHLFQTNLVRCRCINLLSFFFFFQLSNSLTTFVQTSMLWPQAPERPSCRLLQKIKSCAYHQKKISSSSPCPPKKTHRLRMHSVQAWAVWQASTKTWSRFLNSRNTEIPLCLALPTQGYCLSLQFKARHLSVKSQPVFSRKPKNLETILLTTRWLPSPYYTLCINEDILHLRYWKSFF